MAGDINLNELRLRAFGYVARPGYSRLSTDSPLNKPAGYSNLKTSDFHGDETSLLGTALVMPITLGYKDANGNLQTIQLPNEPIIEISGSKTIVKTAVDGQRGTFKELFAINDYQVSIKGIVIQEDGSENYPKDLLRQLREMCERQSAIQITCDLTNIFGITQLVIENYSFPAVLGAQSWQPFILNCLSDFDFDIELTDDAS
jgi:hypothetical protein